MYNYCDTFAGMKKLTLAKKIFEENPGLFPDLRKAYDMVRYYTGSKGAYHRRLNTVLKTRRPLTYDTNTSVQAGGIDATGGLGKILILDIETSPIQAWVWQRWKQNIGDHQVERDWFCLTWSAKWLCEDKVYAARLTAEEAIKQDDSRIIKAIWEFLNEANVVVAHNGSDFDIPSLNTRFVVHGMMPPLSYQIVDTLKHVRKTFRFLSNKLDNINNRLSIRRKKENEGFDLWKRCVAGDVNALADMESYNIDDVLALEETYLVLRPWIKPHPNVGLFILDEQNSRCPTCGSTDLQDEGKMYYTSANAFEQFRCKQCGSTGRKRNTAVNIKQKRPLILSVAK